MSVEWCMENWPSENANKSHADTDHACDLRPGHDGMHICSCGQCASRSFVDSKRRAQ